MVLAGWGLLAICGASRYGGTETNIGEFVKFGPDLQPEIQQFFAHAMDDTAFGLTEAQREANLERDTLHMIIGRIMDKKADLYWYYTHVGDPDDPRQFEGLTTNDSVLDGLRLVAGVLAPLVSSVANSANLPTNTTRPITTNNKATDLRIWLLYTPDAADQGLGVDLGGARAPTNQATQ